MIYNFLPANFAILFFYLDQYLYQVPGLLKSRRCLASGNAIIVQLKIFINVLIAIGVSLIC